MSTMAVALRSPGSSVVLLAALVGSAACSQSASKDREAGGGDEEQPGAPSGEGAVAGEDEASPPEPARDPLDKGLFPAGPEAPALVELESPGRAPRRVLRLAPAAGQVQRSSLAQTNAGDGVPTATIRVTALAKVERVAADGSFRLVTTFSDASFGAMPRGEAQAELLRKASVVQTVATDGNVLATERSHHEAISQDLIDQLSAGVGTQVVLPPEAIGEGARWRARTRRGDDVIELYQEITYTLTRLQGSVAELTMELEQRNETGTIRTEGTGSLQIDLGRPRPVRASARGTLTIDLTGEPQVMTFQVELE